MYKELIISCILIVICIVGVIVLQPASLHLTTEVIEKPGYLVGIIPHFDTLTEEDISHYKITARSNSGDGFSGEDNDSGSYTHNASGATDSRQPLWFTNTHAPDDCLEITTTVTAYNDRGDVHQTEETVDCTMGEKHLGELTETERDDFYGQIENIDIELAPYFGGNLIGLNVTWSEVAETSEYELHQYSNSERLKGRTSPAGQSRSVLLPGVENSGPNDCKELSVSVAAFDDERNLLGYGWEEICQVKK